METNFEEIVTKLRGFLEITGGNLPTEDQWERIKSILHSEKAAPGVQPLNPMYPFNPQRPFYPGLLDTYPYTIGDTGMFDRITCKVSDSGSGGVKLTYEGTPLDNGFGTSDIPEEESLDPRDIGPKILETEAVSFNYRDEVPENDRNDDSYG